MQRKVSERFMGVKRLLQIGVAVLGILLLGGAALLGLYSGGNNKVSAAVDRELVNPLNGYTTTEGFAPINPSEVYNAESNPYAISSEGDLIKLAYYVNRTLNRSDYSSDEEYNVAVQVSTDYSRASYKLTKHLNLSSYNWQPIGTYARPFSGSFNGGGNSLLGLTIVDDTLNNGEYDTVSGLFGVVRYLKVTESGNPVEYTPSIKILGLKDTYIKSNATYVGSIVGIAYGDLDVAINYPMLRDMSEATASVAIQECYNTGYIEGGAYVGGIAGALYDGAILYNSYNMPGYVDVSQENPDAADIYSGLDNASVGGLVGIAAYQGTQVINECYNVSKVSCKPGPSGSTVFLGGILGNKDSVTPAYYNSNLYLNTCCAYSNGVGQSKSESALKSITTYTWSLYWSMESLGTGEWKEYDETQPLDYVWKSSLSFNNGYPVLKRINQLASIDIEVAQTDGIDMGRAYFTGYENFENPQETFMNPALVMGPSKFYFEQGSSFSIIAAVDTANEKSYKFSSWTVSSYSNSLAESVSKPVESVGGSGILMLVTQMDMKFTVSFDYIYYKLNYFASNTNAGQVKAKLATHNEYVSPDFNWDNVAFVEGNKLDAKIGDHVLYSADVRSGYKIDSWKSNSQVIAGVTSTTHEVQVEGPQDVEVIFVPKSYNLTVQSNDPSLGEVYFKINNGINQDGTITTAQYSDVVSLFIRSSADNYHFARWTIKASGLEEYTLDPQSSAITLQDYDNYIITGHFEKDKWNVNLTADPTGGGSVAFDGAHAGPGLSRTVAFDEVTTAKVSEIINGYTFVGWKVKINNAEIDITASPYDTYFTVNIQDQTLTINEIYQDIVCIAVFKMNSYTINITLSDPNAGTVNPSGEMEVVYEDIIGIVASANTGYHFSHWEDSNGVKFSDNPSTMYQVTGEVTITACFIPVKYTVTFFTGITGGSGGSVDKNSFQQTNSNGEYNYNQKVEFAALPPLGYEFSYWSFKTTPLGADEYVFDNTTGKGVINNIRSNIEIMAYFKVKQHSVTYSVNDLGLGDIKFYYNGSLLTYSQAEDKERTYEYTYASLIDMQAVPSSLNYTFAYWTVNGKTVSTTPNASFGVTEDIDIKAFFRPLEYHIGVSQNIPAAGTIYGLSSSYNTFGTQLTLNVAVKPGFKFIGWYDQSALVGRDIVLGTEPEYTFIVDKAYNIQARFVPTVTVQATLASTRGGAVNGEGEYEIGDTVTYTAVANEGYKFVSWNINGNPVSNDPVYTFVASYNNPRVEAYFTPVFMVKTNINNPNLGSVRGAGVCSYGQTINLTAYAENNCTFIGWSSNGRIISTDKNMTLTVNGDLELQALFKANFDFSILIVLVGCLMFAIIMVLGSIAYIKIKEREPIPARIVLTGKDDKDLIKKQGRRNIYRDKIDPVPTRKLTATAIEPVPVRKIVIPPVDHKGKIYTKKEPENKAEKASKDSAKKSPAKSSKKSTKQPAKKNGSKK